MNTGGIVFRAGEELAFLAASVALKVMPLPVYARVPGAPESILGVTIVDGETLPVVCARFPWAPPRSGPTPMLVVSYLGERVGLVGIEVCATGTFESAPEGVLHEGNLAVSFDVGALVGKVRDARWAV